ncbi:Ig-like domain-containing protein [Fulvivirga sediminis]|uniref:Uncharacterized protein n=1 Tax=Fulvivirga sediminis TaxID=2803949 RepID=A0A937F6D1_9BACT|nr:Ig-like domain-containing protein [Fulvivirga sediminis]MBL3657216.1 hypothetical protein [Fulvivirga sediminis]
MNNYFLNSLKLLIFLTPFLLQSCSDDSDGLDNVTSELEFTNLKEGEELWNTVNIQASAKDGISITSLQLFVDDQLLASESNKAVISSDWNTSNTEDGKHTLKVIATNASQNSTEKEITVMVKNNLITLQVPDYELRYGEEGYIFLSDRNGKLIASEPLIAGKEITLKNNNFQDSIFFLTELYDSQSREYALIQTFSDVKRGSHWNISNTGKFSSNTLKADITFTNVSENGYFRAYSNGDDSAYIIGDLGHQESLSLSRSPSYLYTVKFDDAHQPISYNLFKGIHEGENIVDLSQVNKTFDEIEIKLPDYDLYNYFLYGIDGEGKSAKDFEVDYESNSEAGVTTTKISYAGESFENYRLEFNWSKDNYNYSQYIYGLDHLELKEINHDFDFHFKDKGFSYSATGDFDVAFYDIWGDINEKVIYWTVTLPQATERIVPEIELPENLEFLNILKSEHSSSINFEDYDQFNDYYEILEFISHSESGYYGVTRYDKNYVSVEYELDN